MVIYIQISKISILMRVDHSRRYAVKYLFPKNKRKFLNNCFLDWIGNIFPIKIIISTPRYMYSWV